MATRKKKVSVRFNVGTMTKQLKELQEKTALEHEKVFDCNKRSSGKASQSTKNSAKGYLRFTFFFSQYKTDSVHHKPHLLKPLIQWCN